jgi:hypothetical protein
MELDGLIAHERARVRRDVLRHRGQSGHVFAAGVSNRQLAGQLVVVKALLEL